MSILQRTLQQNINPVNVAANQSPEYRNYQPFGPNPLALQQRFAAYVARGVVGQGQTTNPVISWQAQAQNKAEWDRNSNTNYRAVFMYTPVGQYQTMNLAQQQHLRPMEHRGSTSKFKAFIHAINIAAQQAQGGSRG